MAGKDEDEDIKYGIIQETNFYKKRGRWIPTFEEFLGTVEGWNSSSSFCKIGGYRRKKKKNIFFVNEMSKNEYLLAVEKMEKQEKRERLALLQDKKKRILHTYSLGINFFGDKEEEVKKILEKVKYAKKLEKLYEAQEVMDNILSCIREKERKLKFEEEENKKKMREEENKKKIEGLLKKMRDTFVDGEVNPKVWVNFPESVRHPAPKNIMDLKNESGLSWNSFENTLALD